MYSNIKVYQKYRVTSIKVGYATRSLYASSGPKAEGVPTKIQKSWCTVTVAPTIEHHGGPCKPEVIPGAREESASPAWLAAPAMNARDTTKVYIWRLDTRCGPTLYRKCHSHNTPGKRHNDTRVEPLAGNCTTSSTRQREQVWQKCKIQKNWCIYGGLTLDVDRHYIGSVIATTHQEKGIITLESNPSRKYNLLPAVSARQNLSLGSSVVHVTSQSRLMP